MKIMMFKMIFLVLLAQNMISLCFASIEAELQEIRLAKAELLLLDGKVADAMLLIKKNIHDAKNVHVASYLFLVEYLRKQERFQAMFSIYEEAILRLGGEKAFFIIYSRDYLKNFEGLRSPDIQVMDLIFSMALNYYSLSQHSKVDEKKQKKYKEVAKRYFELCVHLNQPAGHAQYYLGLILVEQQKHSEAVASLFYAQDFFKEQAGDDNNGTHQVMDFYIGSGLLGMGKTDAGILYLMSVYHSPQTNDSIKQYADIYLRAYSNEMWSFGVSSSLKYQSNIHLFSDRNQPLDPSYVSEYKKLSGIYKNISGTGYYNSGMGKRISTAITGYLLSSSTLDRDQNIRDSSTIGGTALVQWNRPVRQTPGVNASYYLSTYRPQKNAEAKTFFRVLTVSPQLNMLTKKGIVTGKLNVTEGINFQGYHLMDYGLSIAYVPHAQNKWLSPSYLASASLEEEATPADKTKAILASFSNNSTFGKYGDFFTTFKVNKNFNDTATLEFFDITFNMLYTRAIKRYPGLSASISLGFFNRTDGNDDDYVDQTVEGKIGYIF